MTQPIRVLQVLGCLNRGGAEAMIMNLYRNIDREKVQFDFVVHTEDKCVYDHEVEQLGGCIYHCPKYKGWNHAQYVFWWTTFFENHPNYRILHSHIRSSAAVFFRIAKKSGVVTIAHSHNTSNGTGIASIVKKVFQNNICKYADACFACGEAAGKWLFKKDSFTVLNNAIDVQKFAYDERKRKEARKEFQLDESILLVGTVGRFIAQKNPSGIIEIIKQLHTVKPEAKFLWVGDGEMRHSIEKTIHEECLQETVIFTGVRNDVDMLLQAMDVFIMPSLWEGLPVVGIEAQASGLPCLFSENVTRETQKTALCRFLPIDNPKLWVDCILECTENPRVDTRQQLIDAGYDICSTSLWLQEFYLEKADLFCKNSIRKK